MEQNAQLGMNWLFLVYMRRTEAVWWNCFKALKQLRT